MDHRNDMKWTGMDYLYLVSKSTSVITTEAVDHGKNASTPSFFASILNDQYGFDGTVFF